MRAAGRVPIHATGGFRSRNVTRGRATCEALYRVAVWMYSHTVRPPHIEKLSDEFGQYLIVLSCACGHVRQAYPQTLAAISGWEAKLEDVVRRMRCTKCGERKCAARVVPLTTPRGYKSH
jgi:hypothetical protein